MAWPSVSSVTEGIMGFIAPSSTSSDAEAAPAPAADTATETVATEPTTTPSPTETPTPATTEPVTPAPEAPTDAAKIAADPKAWLASLDDATKEKLGGELNKSWYKRLDERDKAFARLESQREADRAEAKRYADERIDEILTTGMSDDEKQQYNDRRELERHRAAEELKKVPAVLSPAEEQALVAKHPATAEFWRIVAEAGLPQSTDDPRVRSVWQEAFHAADPVTAIATMRSAAAKHAVKKETAPSTSPEDVAKLASEMAEKLYDERIKKMGVTRADTGRPGASGGKTSPPNSYAEARKAAEEMLRAT